MKLFIPSLLALLALAPLAAADPVSPAFTYQGRLDRNGAPANGSFDLKFELYDVAEGGVPIKEAELPAQNITGGLMTADLNFEGPEVFDGTAYWIAVYARAAGAADFTPVPGRTAVRPTPYAIQALSALSVKDGAITGSSLADGAVTSAKLAPAAIGRTQLSAPGNPGAGQMLGFDGNELAWITPAGGAGGTSPWLAGTGGIFYSAGRVGIGRSNPAHTLSIGGPLPGWTASGWGGAIDMQNGAAIGWGTNAAGSRFGIGQATGGLYFFRTTSNPGTMTAPAVYDLYINDGGNVVMSGGGPGVFTVGAPNGETGQSLQRNGNRADVRFDGTALKLVAGVGAGPPPSSNGLFIDTTGATSIGTATPNPGYKLSVNGGVQFTPGSVLGGTVQFGSPNTELGMTITPGNAGRADLRFDGSVFKMLAGPAGGPPANTSGVAVTTGGNVGIGTTTPGTKLDVAGDTRMRSLILGNNPGTNDAAVYSDSAASTRVVLWNLANNGLMDLHCRKGDVSSLTIRGGADLAEPFAMSHEGVEPGTVVVIDEKNPGKLKASVRAYDKKVAGIVSGANGIRPGISMIQEDKLEAGENVALSGRVYVKADNSAGTIEPGDLLTTSSKAGHAMKAAHHDKAQGAIIGKAMTSLNESEGMVLVLVTLQ